MQDYDRAAILSLSSSLFWNKSGTVNKSSAKELNQLEEKNILRIAEKLLNNDPIQQEEKEKILKTPTVFVTLLNKLCKEVNDKDNKSLTHLRTKLFIEPKTMDISAQELWQKIIETINNQNHSSKISFFPKDNAHQSQLTTLYKKLELNGSKVNDLIYCKTHIKKIDLPPVEFKQPEKKGYTKKEIMEKTRNNTINISKKLGFDTQTHHDDNEQAITQNESFMRFAY